MSPATSSLARSFASNPMTIGYIIVVVIYPSQISISPRTIPVVVVVHRTIIAKQALGSILCKVFTIHPRSLKSLAYFSGIVTIGRNSVIPMSPAVPLLALQVKSIGYWHDLLPYTIMAGII